MTCPKRWLLALAMVEAATVCAARAGTVTLQAFDENGEGASCDFARFKAVSNCALHKGWDTDCLLQADSYDCLAMQPLHAIGGNLAFEAKGRCLLSVAWPTENTGYNNLLLDNEGKGWESDASILFNLQAAKDTRRRLGDALKARPDYAQSAAFATLRSEGESLLRQADAAPSDSDKGKCGQVALDRFLQAYNLLLRDYGVQRSRAIGGQGLCWGFTIDRVAKDNAKYLLPIQELVAPSDKGWIRLVCDKRNKPSYYQPIIAEARSRRIHILLQILDSVDNKKTSLDQSNQRVRDYVDAFGDKVDAYEIGNEVNMEPFPQMIEKMEYAADYIKRNAPASRIAVVLFWQLGTGYGKKGNGAYTTFDYINHAARSSAVLTRNVDLWLVSMYPEGYPLGPVCFDELMTRLQNAFPDGKIGVGELDYWLPRTDRVWWWGNAAAAPEDTRPEFLRWHYAAAAGYENSILGGFWWGYIPEMSSRNALWNAAHQLFLEMNPAEATAGETP
ncbi:MAG: hypothetical protein NTW86_25715 [Candidatus Sumerlaeota bacterium]|nr:hypothetical protein [Candidatus Sumerlaeota bacterium]